MKCPSCGAEIGNSKTCEFCGTPVSYDMKKEQEQMNKQGCPKCGSTNISFSREKQGEVHGKKGTAVVRATVGVCKDCGYTWNTSGKTETKKNNSMLWWVLGWIFFFPAPVMVLIWRKKNTWDIKVKIAVTVVFWVLIFILGSGGDNKEAISTKQSTEVETVESSEETAEISKETKESYEDISDNATIYSDAKIVDIMSGSGDNKVGEMSLAHANSADCTEEALTDWFFNYVQNNSNCNYHIIVYKDNPQKGIYAIKTFVQKDVALIKEANGTYSTGDDAGSTYYMIDDANKTLISQGKMVDTDVIAEIKDKVDKVIPDEYKQGKLYSVDVAGEEGKPVDCNLTLVNDSFANADYQGIAEGLAKEIKELDLNIGYFCIAFQSDDYTLNAISNMDDLSSEDASSISTKKF